ncbi:unnamed protein product [Boreogadus saida]
MEKSKEMEEMRRGYRGGWGDLDGRHSACEPLITACREGRAEVIEQLLRGGADATLCTPQGRTALHACPPDLQGALLGWMLRPHLPPQACLWRAAWLGDLHTLRQLLAGPDTLDLNAPNPDGLTALMLSVRDVDLMQVLVENRLSSPWQPRHGEVVRELLLLSVDVCIHDNRGWSALDYALNINGPQKDDIVHMLLKVLTKTVPRSYDRSVRVPAPRSLLQVSQQTDVPAPRGPPLDTQRGNCYRPQKEIHILTTTK